MSCATSLAQDLPGAVPQSKIYRITPLDDPRWNSLVNRHASASVFHSSSWLRALSLTYAYQPVAFTTSAPTEERLRNALLFCYVDSWLTGRRLVSLPFSDHCEPLVDSENDLQMLLAGALRWAQRDGCRYIEIRPLHRAVQSFSGATTTVEYPFHEVRLAPDLQALFSRLHKSSTQRKIRRAARESLVYCEGTSVDLLNSFYQLFQLTRARHNTPPQPREWFDNLMLCFGEAAKIRVAKKDRRSVAAILTIRFKDTLVYKYGSTDSRFNKFGGIHLLLWRSIIEAKESGLQYFDLGRTNPDQLGLITFKNRWGAEQSALHYTRYSLAGESTHWLDLLRPSWKSATARHLLALLPLSILNELGDILYKHAG